MPPDGYETVTVPESLHDRLTDMATADESIASVIERSVDDVEPHDDALTADEFEARMRDFTDDVASTTATRAADEIESRLR
jgi:hypothetical protein